ncbi:HlyD family secretion protein [Bacillus mesophilus]|uniref:Efflux RND transporter periplasmic adaptor subunit n=1 Tax=Bacillus mesophilus TaxID=1808955 RepID=A0A6M0Q5U3_9BACI|nr:efflux RND transporter periplasmic adaptor subunit [Bacillus mesophilus]MBM7659999.1 HlyD family secretion protein [Bacillus mesophilus]NEY70860.1 efflux RND transporter periplasmic adaptor subunit [Bacillus mesophilus]
MKKWIWSSIIILVLCLILGNLYLLKKYDADLYFVSKVDAFHQPVEGDIRISHFKKGVVTAQEESVISYQPQLGVIEEILVKEGDFVQVGTPLVQYSTTQSEGLIQQLESKIERAQAEERKLSKDISALKSISYPTVFESEWEEAQAEANEILIDSQIRELELKEELLEIDIEDYELQLESIENEADAQTILSTTDGIVKSINKNGKDELITIITYPYVIKGELSEQELQSIQVGQKVYISKGKQPLIGTISDISQFPVNSPSLHEETSYFPFTINVEEVEDQEQLLFGHHIGVEVVQQESFATLLLPEHSVLRNRSEYSAFVMEKGKVKEVELQLGIESKGRIEILDGISMDDIVVGAPDKLIKADTPFIMPVKKLIVKSSQLEDVNKKEATTTILRAMIAN